MFPNFDRRFSLYRKTNYILDPVAAAASLTPDRQPPSAAVIEVKLAGGTTGSGTVTVSGTLSTGLTHSQSLSFDGNGVRDTGGYAYSSLDPLTTTGLTNEAAPPTVSAVALGRDGQLLTQDYLLAAGRPGALKTGRSTTWATAQSGAQVAGAETVLLCYETAYTPRSGDEVRDDSTGERWLLEDPTVLPGPYQPLYWRARGRRVG